MSKNFMFSLLGQGNVIPIHREIVRLVGSYECAALLEQIVYWMPRASSEGRYVYKTRLEWMEELLLTEHQFKAARAKLRALELLEEKTVRVERGHSHVNVPAYRLNLTHLQTLLEAEVVKIADSNPGVSPTRGGENHQVESEVFLEAEVVKIADSIKGTEPTYRTYVQNEEESGEKFDTESFGADAPLTLEAIDKLSYARASNSTVLDEAAHLEQNGTSWDERHLSGYPAFRACSPSGPVRSADALNDEIESNSFQETPLQKIEVGQKTPLDEKNLSGGAAGPVHKSGDKSKKALQEGILAEIRALVAPRSVAKFWEEWREHVLERNPKVTLRAASKQLECLGRWLGEGKNLRHIVDYSIQGNYQGLFGDDAKFDPARPGGSSSTARASPGQSFDVSRYDLSQPAPQQVTLASSDEEIPF